MENKMRLQKFIAACGITSRRQAEELIVKGMIKVNNKKITELGTSVDITKDQVEYKGNILKISSKKIYLMLNKPIGYVCSNQDKYAKHIITELTSSIEERIFPIGRLDSDTSGLILLTNDGDITNRLLHPKNDVFKKYIAIVEGTPKKNELEKLRRGFMLEGKRTKPSIVKIKKVFDIDSIIEINISEGRNRQIKKMMSQLGHPVKKLKRIAIGEIELNDLPVGRWRYLNETELEYIKSL